MATISKPFTFSQGATIIASEHNSNFDVIFNDHNGNITTANFASSISIPDSMLAQVTTASKITGSSLTSLDQIPAAAGIIPAANLPSATSTTHYRSEMLVAYASTTTLTVGVGVLDVNGVVSKTAATTMTISSAGDWAGGVSLRATSTVGYVGVDEDGNIKLHTTAPAYSDYAVSNSAGKKRYASWSGTVYRIIGWFYMNATGSGELDTYGVSNLSDGTVRNTVMYTTGAVATGTTVFPKDDTIPQSGEGDLYMSLPFVPTGSASKLRTTVVFNGVASAVANNYGVGLFQDATAGALGAAAGSGPAAASPNVVCFTVDVPSTAITVTTLKVRAGVESGGGTLTFNGHGGLRLYGGVEASSIRIEEID